MKVKVLLKQKSRSINKSILPLHCRWGGGGGSQNDPPNIFQISQQHMKHFQQVFRGEGLKI